MNVESSGLVPGAAPDQILGVDHETGQVFEMRTLAGSLGLTVSAAEGLLTVVGPTLYASGQSSPATTTTASSILTPTTTSVGSLYLPAGFLAYAGQAIDIDLMGEYNTTSTAPTCVLTVWMGTTQVLTGTVTLPASQVYNAWGTTRIQLIVQSLGTAGTVAGFGIVYFASSSTPVLCVLSGNTSPDAGAAVIVNTTIAQTLDVRISFTSTGHAVITNGVSVRTA
jgi:hypothetical protein